MSNSVIQTLIGAKALIENVGWAQGIAVKPNFKTYEYEAYCVVGAISAASNLLSIQNAAHNYLKLALPPKDRLEYYGVSIYNDKKGMTKRAILCLFDRAIAIAKQDDEL